MEMFDEYVPLLRVPVTDNVPPKSLTVVVPEYVLSAEHQRAGTCLREIEGTRDRTRHRSGLGFDNIHGRVARHCDGSTQCAT